MKLFFFVLIATINVVHSKNYCSWTGCDGVKQGGWCDTKKWRCEGNCGGTWCSASQSTPTPPPTPPPTDPPVTSAPITPAYGGGASKCGCKFPDGATKYSVITKEDASIAAHNIYSAVAIGGHLSNPQSQSSIVVKGSDKSYMKTLQSNPNINFQGGKQTGVDLDTVIDFEQFEWLAQNAKNSNKNGKKVIVKTSGGTFDMYDFVPGGQGEDNGNTLVIFNTSDKVILTKTHDGRQFGPSVIAPFSTVELKDQAG